MVNSVMSGISGVSSNLQQQQQPLLLGVDAASYLGSSHESLGQQQQQVSSNGNLWNSRIFILFLHLSCSFSRSSATCMP